MTLPPRRELGAARVPGPTSAWGGAGAGPRVRSPPAGGEAGPGGGLGTGCLGPQSSRWSTLLPSGEGGWPRAAARCSRRYRHAKGDREGPCSQGGWQRGAQTGILGWGCDVGDEGSFPPRGTGRGPARRVAKALLQSPAGWTCAEGGAHGPGPGLAADLVLRRSRSPGDPLTSSRLSLTSSRDSKQVYLVNVKGKGGLEGKEKNVE